MVAGVVALVSRGTWGRVGLRVFFVRPRTTNGESGLA
jgi:hypothetical protein